LKAVDDLANITGGAAVYTKCVYKAGS